MAGFQKGAFGAVARCWEERAGDGVTVAQVMRALRHLPPGARLKMEGLAVAEVILRSDQVGAEVWELELTA